MSAGNVSFTYDLLGRRISRSYNNSTTTYVWDGAQIIAEYTDGSLTKKYIYGPGIDNPVAMINVSGETEDWYYYYADALGNVRLMTNAAGYPVESYTYDAYGRPYVMTAAGGDGNWLTEDVTTGNSSSIGNPYMFTGRRWDSITGLYYYRFRDYAPELGRFLQTDPAGYIDTMNLYAYCANNPVNWIDPWGLWGEGAHRNLGRYGSGGPGSKFDYARLDRDHPATNPIAFKDRARHFRPLGAAVRDAKAAARNHDPRNFELHMHEVQDYYSHTAAGKGPKLGHWTHEPDKRNTTKKRSMYRAADQKTRELEDYWDKYNPPKEGDPDFVGPPAPDSKKTS